MTTRVHIEFVATSDDPRRDGRDLLEMVQQIARAARTVGYNLETLRTCGDHGVDLLNRIAAEDEEEERLAREAAEAAHAAQLDQADDQVVEDQADDQVVEDQEPVEG